MDRLLSLVQMAEKLSCSAKTFKRLISKYNIPHYEVGTRLRFDPVEVLAHLSAKKEEQAVKAPVIRTSVRKTRAGLLSERLGI